MLKPIHTTILVWTNLPFESTLSENLLYRQIHAMKGPIVPV